MWENATKYLSADAEELMDVELWNNMYNQDIVASSHLLMRFSMLDRLADAFGTPQQSTFIALTRHQLPSISRALERVRIFLSAANFVNPYFIDPSTDCSLDKANQAGMRFMQPSRRHSAFGGG